MAVVYQNTQPTTIWYQKSTRNKSFLEMHYFLKDKGIKNNAFMLVLFDPDLAGIDPFDPNLNVFYKTKILRECMFNVWYFLREIVRVPTSGTAVGVPFRLNRGSMATIFCLVYNINIFLELPRQTGKTTVALCWYLWCWLLGTSNSYISFLHKKLDDSKRNLSDMREIKDLLPSYLKVDEAYGMDGKKLKATSTVETMSHPVNKNRIVTVASARSKTHAASLMRGRTTPQIYIDEHAFIPYNQIMYSNMVPAFNTASSNARMNGKPYGILLTTTPGILTTDEGLYSYNMKEHATVFAEGWYDLSYAEIMNITNSNSNSNYVYIKFTYQQLGMGEDWFREVVRNSGKDFPAIRREILLEWAMVTDNSPFNPEDLETLQTLLRQPISSILLLRKYTMEIYKQINLQNPPIIGVDVSGGYNKDSSAITIIDSTTTETVAVLNCNYISTIDMAGVLFELVTKFMPNAVINIERNGGYGSSVLSKLVCTSIKKNLYYEIKDRVLEERFNGVNISRSKQRVKVYGMDSTKETRELLIGILRERIEYHKDKVISPIIYGELQTLEVKKDGRVEHSSNAHDDTIFSWLWALYVYYYGKNLMETYGVIKHELQTDQMLLEAYIPLEDKVNTALMDLSIHGDDLVNDQLNNVNTKVGSTMYNAWMEQQLVEDDNAMNELLMNPVARSAYATKFNVSEADINMPKMTTLPDSFFSGFTDDNGFNDND